MKSYMVIGLGLFGEALARELCALGAEVLAMDVRGSRPLRFVQMATLSAAP